MNRPDISTAVYNLEIDIREALEKFFKDTGIPVEGVKVKKVRTNLKEGEDGLEFSPVYEILTKFSSYL